MLAKLMDLQKPACPTYLHANAVQLAMRLIPFACKALMVCMILSKATSVMLWAGASWTHGQGKPVPDGLTAHCGCQSVFHFPRL